MIEVALFGAGRIGSIHAGNLSRLEVLRLLPQLAIAGAPRNHPKVRQGQCRRLVVRSPAALTVHIDGEFFARPEDNIRYLDIQLHQAALRVQLAAVT